MNIRKNTYLEKKMTLSEDDMVGGGERLILVAYATKNEDELWSYPTPQIYDQEIYSKYKETYDQAVINFRNECEVE